MASAGTAILRMPLSRGALVAARMKSANQCIENNARDARRRIISTVAGTLLLSPTRERARRNKLADIGSTLVVAGASAWRAQSSVASMCLTCAVDAIVVAETFDASRLGSRLAVISMPKRP